jgi:eukaryotic-like serine/threonine-protein kinase
MIAGRYRLLELIGSGGMGIVWLAFDTVEPRQVALKRPHAGAGPGMREQLLREAEVAARVAHPNAIKVFDVVVDGDACWLVMEYFNAVSLADLLNRLTALPPLRVAGIGTQIAAALTAAHAVEVVHRDVTPANILVANDGTAKVTDYGISAWRAATVTSSGKISGTAAYVSPEVANGSGAKAPSDVYSLGATLYAAVEGEPPCGTGDPEVVLARLRDGMISPVRRAGPLAPVLAALLHSDPRCRPTAEQATDMLGTVAQGREVPPWVPPVVSEPRTTPLSRGSFLRRRSTLVGLAAAIVVVALVVILLPLWRDDPSAGAGGPTKPNTDIAPVLGDPRTADPCALMDPNALARFGDTELDKEYGGFNRCDILVDPQGDGSEEQIDVMLQLLDKAADEPPRPKLTMTDPTMADGNCEAMLILTDGYRVNVTAKGEDELDVDLCAMTTAAANAATARMSDGELPRRTTPFPAESLANLEACALGDPAAVLPELAGASPEPGFAKWDCEWHAADAGVELNLEHSSPLTPGQDGEQRDIGGRLALVDNDGTERCITEVPVRQYPNDQGDARVDLLQIVAAGVFPTDHLCEMSFQFASTVVATLPT